MRTEQNTASPQRLSVNYLVSGSSQEEEEQIGKQGQCHSLLLVSTTPNFIVSGLVNKQRCFVLRFFFSQSAAQNHFTHILSDKPKL